MSKTNEVQVLDGFVDGSTFDADQLAKLEQISKYELIKTDRDTELPPYWRLEQGDEQGLMGQDIVAVFDKGTEFCGVIHRQLTGIEVLDERRKARTYRIVGVKPCGRDEALATVWAPRKAEAAAALGSLVPTGEEPF